ncbi:ABC transporter substrate-binding protein [Actinomadura sp. KC216]|uniref:ABC transporter substrate-binding protein n=1 Tax=Actinomadura sp. KC216 TaxID=2530370 RepID=UPI0014047B42|nr:ABC transporter substrate-binding protein [Actinomadura sp. KC216]
MTASHRRAAVAGAVAVAVALAASACGGEDGASANGLEKSEILLGTMTIADTASVQLALSKGLFKAEGLTVKTQVIQGGAAGIPLLRSGRLDISFGNYVSLFTAGVKDPRFKPKIIAEGFNSAAKTHVVMVRGDSPHKTIKDLAGKRIAVNTKRNISTLLIRSAGQAQGVTFDDDKSFVEVPPPAMEHALKSGSVEAVQAIEPFGTQMQRSMGARMVADLSSGQTANLPIAGYAATEKFVEKNPKTVAAFQRALVKAQGMCADRKVVENVLPTYAKGIDAKVAAGMGFGEYPTTLDPAHLKRVADLMQRFGYVDKPIDVKNFVATPS